MGISHRRLTGWEPKETTQHVYKKGKLFRTITTREAEWDLEQLELVLAYEAYKRDLGSHGHPLSRSTSPDADPNNYESPLRYVAHGPFTDWAAKAQLDAVDAYKAALPDGAKANLNGMYFTVEEVGL